MSRTATTEQVARALHVQPATVRGYAREARIPFDVTPGGHRRFDVGEVVEALATPFTPEPDLILDAGTYVRVPGRVVGGATLRVRPVHRPVVALDSPDEADLWASETTVV